MKPVYLHSIISMGGLGALLAFGLGYASRVFSVERDVRIDEVEEALPGANCGACGFAGCGSFAEAVVSGDAEITGCPVGGDSVADNIAEIMGSESDSSQKEVARVLCKGGDKETTKQSEYQGIESCQAAEVINAGSKSCQYGCLGFGDCVDVCPFDAIEMNENGLPEVIPEKCTACGKCVEACPRDIIVLAPESGQNHIECRSHAGGKRVRKICEVGCIGCSMCARVCPVDAITMEDGLAVIDYEECINCGLCAEKCPTGTITFEGKRIKEIEITDDCVGCTRCVDPCPEDAIDGELKEQHKIDNELCIKCGVCYDVCSVDGAIQVKYDN
jgi:RnfABCDGE-type electron transport complex B subunit